MTEGRDAGGPAAADRRLVAKAQGPKDARWPRTARRRERVAAVLARRQPDLAVVLEDVHDPHNAAAVLRSCDAVGVLRVHTVYATEERPGTFARTTSASAAKWVEVVDHPSIDACYRALRAAGMAVVATAVGPGSTDLYGLDLTRPTALVFGNEQRGVSAEALAGADALAAIPMLGMVESLNVSVACAVALYEAMRQRRAAGAYDAPKLSAEALAALEREWLER